MPTSTYKIAIIGAGPGGLSAAARAAECGVSHILLEAAKELSNTIRRYSKGKLVLAEPRVIPLRSSISFEADSRERVLEVWEKVLKVWDKEVPEYKKKKWLLPLKMSFNAKVKTITGSRGNFSVVLEDGEAVQAEFVVLATGIQGNLRKLGIPEEDLPFVEYQLDDPKDYRDETIVVVGAGDAAIENAIALSEGKRNRVILVNRRDEFDRAKEANRSKILRAIEKRKIECYYQSAPVRVEASDGRTEKRGIMILKTKEGEETIPCDSVIARLGAMPPRGFVESFGIEFPNADPNAVPAVSDEYQSNVKGLYIIGTLAGCELIKQAMNQGWEVIEFIEGRTPEPIDEAVLREKFGSVPEIKSMSVRMVLDLIQKNVPVLSGLTTLQLRAFLLDSAVVAPKRGEVLFRHNDFSNEFFSIVRGTVHVQIDPQDASKRVTLSQGDFFGEMSLISGRRRNTTAIAGEACVLIETPRRAMNKLIHSVESVKRIIDHTFLRRAIQTQIAPELPAEALREAAESARTQRYKLGEELFHEGDPGDCLHLIRRGSVTVSRKIGGRDCVLRYVAAGNYVGEMELLSDIPRSATVRAAINDTETIRLEAVAFKKLLAGYPEIQAKMQRSVREQLARQAEEEQKNPAAASDLISFLTLQGIPEAVDALLIDESLCVRCDHCEKACAETHDGISRLDREAGPTFAFIHVPTSCRHCEHPHCMKDCPPDAIRRASNGEVYILDSCIGCENCMENCPYGVIKMAPKEKPKPVNLISWLLFGKGRAPGEEISLGHTPGTQTIATKCDMCKDVAGGPACVRACPTGAAIRVSPQEFMNRVRPTASA